MTDPVQAFWVGDSGVVEMTLRRYRLHDEPTCPTGGYHHAGVDIGGAAAHRDTRGFLMPIPLDPHLDDDRWPTHCECGYQFDPITDEWTVDQDTIYVRSDTGQRWRHRDLPPGAMLDAFWLPDHWKGPDGIGLETVLPDGSKWYSDMRARGCTRTADDPGFTRHKCWVRHGDPKAVPADVTVDKHGETCGAGGGSIQTPGWHGWLHDGWFTE